MHEDIQGLSNLGWKVKPLPAGRLQLVHQSGADTLMSGDLETAIGYAQTMEKKGIVSA